MPLKRGIQGPGTGPALALTPVSMNRTSTIDFSDAASKHRHGGAPRMRFRGGALVFTVLIIITIDGVLGVGGVVTVVINPGETHMTIHKAGNALGVAIERHIAPASFAFVPGQRRMGSPFHNQE